MISSWYRHDIPMTFLWYPYDIPMVSIWYSYDIPMIPFDTPTISIWYPYEFHSIWLTICIHTDYDLKVNTLKFLLTNPTSTSTLKHKTEREPGDCLVSDTRPTLRHSRTTCYNQPPTHALWSLKQKRTHTPNNVKNPILLNLIHRAWLRERL